VAVALTAHPLSNEYRDRLETLLGERPEYVNLSHLRRRPAAEIARTVARLQRRQCFLPLEDQSGRVLLPLLEAVAAMLRPRSIEIVAPDLSRTSVRRLAAIPSIAAVAAATIDGVVTLRRARTEIGSLQELQRLAVPFDGPNRVLHLNGNLWFGVKAGGSVGHIAGVVNGFTENGYEVDILAVTPLPSGVKPEVGFEQLRVPNAFGLPPEINTYRFQREVEHRTVAVARERGSGVLYQRLSLATHAGALAARTLHIPFVVEYNGSEAWVQRHWGRALRHEDVALAAEEVTLAHAHLVVTVSEVLRDELVERGVEPERIVCYPNCFDPALFDPARFGDADRRALLAAHDLPPESVVATFVGTFGQWHGVDVLAHAIRRLTDERADWLREQRLHFLLVGDGLRMPEVRAILGKRLEFCTLTGLVPQSDAPRYLAASDLLLSPHVRNADGTRFFGSPTKLFEYMGMGRAIVASRLDQIGDVLQPGLDASALPVSALDETDAIAVLTEPGSVSELVNGIEFLVGRPEWRSALGDNARKRALARFTWRHHVDAILEGIDRVRP
jgi:glycosyltransferase involved in cell wall biosynthesis